MVQAKASQIPARIPLIISPENRDTSTAKDSRLINCYVEIDHEKNVNLFRRPGMKEWGVPAGAGATGLGSYWWNGNVYSIFNNGSTLPAPTLATISTSTTGGTIAAGTYYYNLTCYNLAGETTASNQLTIITTGTTSTITIGWNSIGGAAGYYVYRGTSATGPFTKIKVPVAGITSWTDTGITGPSNYLPGTNTATGATLYKNLASVATGLEVTGGVYSFNSIMGADPKLVFQNGNAGYAYDDTALVSGPLNSIDSSYPQYTCKGIAYLDGFTFVLQHFFGTQITPAVIWGSVVNHVDSNGDWDPLDFITAQMTSDSGVYLAKQLVYVVCIKEWSTEFFYDAGNATGSPLAAAMNLRLSYGCAAQDSVQTIADVLFWVSNNREASNQIVMVEKAQLAVISTPEIDRLLRDADLSSVYSWHIKIDGHSFYVLTLKNNNLTLAFDINQNRWEQWTDSNGNYLPIVSSARNQAGQSILQHETNGTLYYGSTDYLDDNGSLIPITVITPRWDGGTSRKKQASMLNFVCDMVPGSLMSVQVSDNDYQSWSQPRIVDLSQQFPNLIHCGTFRRRAWKFQVNHNLPWRLNAMELQFDIGTL